jgi:ascorbate-specific PTS system EIIC-type component UlaA
MYPSSSENCSLFYFLTFQISKCLVSTVISDSQLVSLTLQEDSTVTHPYVHKLTNNNKNNH